LNYRTLAEFAREMSYGKDVGSAHDFRAKFDRFRTGEALEDLMQRSLS